MRDPVTGFEYPEEWVEACKDPALLPDVERGLALLTADGTVLRRGFTTGTTAAAACKAAILSLAGDVDGVAITLPCLITVDLPARGRGGTGSCVKDAGDHPSDATAGLVFIAGAEGADEGLTLEFGEGIGRFGEELPGHDPGAPAVSETALSSILGACLEGLEGAGCHGARVLLRVPGGKEAAGRTLNPRLGIGGGISVLGTTGFVEPWDEHLVASVLSRVRASDCPVLTTGRTGLKFSRLLFPDREVILVGGKIREALEAAGGEAILCGLPGLILRELNPRILDGTGCRTVEQLLARDGWREAIEPTLADFHGRMPGVRVVLFDRSGRVLGGIP
ncbi:MAG TPA: cobalt-precorrin-5B (C(1))-methyltransferase [Methanomicrobiales archaeon]|nr:cobalt-precorrin-5B (C(1))-methyltransferase [Methanomicrobiales archaeon]